MKLDHCLCWRSVPVLLALSLSACTTNPDGTQSANKTGLGAMAGAVVGIGVGVAVGGKTDKERRRNAKLGAVAGAAVGAVAGATLDYIDREIQKNKTLLSNKRHAELAEIEARLHVLEKEASANYQLIGENSREMRRLQTRHEYYDRNMKKLLSYRSINESRTYSTSEAIRKVNVQIDNTNREESSDNKKLEAEFESQKNELQNQRMQLSKQKKVISSLLATINKQNQILSKNSQSLS